MRKLSRYKNNVSILLNCYLSLSSVVSLNELNSRIIGSKINNNISENILIGLHKNLKIDDFNSVDYVIQLLYMLEFYDFKEPVDNQKRNIFLQNLIDNPCDFKLINEFITLITFTDYGDLSISNNDYNFIFLIMKKSFSDESNINKIIELLEYFDIDNELLNNELNNLANEYVEMELDGYISEITTEDVNFLKDTDEFYGYIVQDGDIETYVNDSLLISIKKIDYFSGYLIDKKKILTTINIESINEKLVESYADINGEIYDHKDIVSGHSNIDSIDDLFER